MRVDQLNVGDRISLGTRELRVHHVERNRWSTKLALTLDGDGYPRDFAFPPEYDIDVLPSSGGEEAK